MAPTRERSTASVTFLAPLVAFIGLVGAGCNAGAHVGAPWDAGPPPEKVAAGLAPDLALGPSNDALAAITTPNESAEKMPWFATGPSYAPSLGYDEANALFDGATAEVPLPATGMLACRLTTTKSSLSGPLGGRREAARDRAPARSVGSDRLPRGREAKSKMTWPRTSRGEAHLTT